MTNLPTWQHIESIEAHLDAGGRASPANVREMLEAMKAQYTHIKFLESKLPAQGKDGGTTDIVTVAKNSRRFHHPGNNATGRLLDDMVAEIERLRAEVREGDSAIQHLKEQLR